MCCDYEKLFTLQPKQGANPLTVQKIILTSALLSLACANYASEPPLKILCHKKYRFFPNRLSGGCYRSRIFVGLKIGNKFFSKNSKHGNIKQEQHNDKEIIWSKDNPEGVYALEQIDTILQNAIRWARKKKVPFLYVLKYAGQQFTLDKESTSLLENSENVWPTAFFETNMR